MDRTYHVPTSSLRLDHHCFAISGVTPFQLKRKWRVRITYQPRMFPRCSIALAFLQSQRGRAPKSPGPRRKDARAIPPTAHMFRAANTCCRTVAIRVSCMTQRNEAIMSVVPTRSCKKCESTAFSAINEKPMPTFDHSSFTSEDGGDESIFFSI
jgi:hypothetical protein